MVRVKTVKTKYWRPGSDYAETIFTSIGLLVKDGDIIVVSEKAVSTAEGNIFDENKINPNFLAKFFVRFWMHVIWGYFLGQICHLRTEQIKHLRSYPVKEGAAHKQFILNYAGVLQVLKYSSEGGVDLNNMPYSYACLPLNDPVESAKKIYDRIKIKTGKSIGVIISDTDSTFSFRNFHFTSRSSSLEDIKSFGGVFAFIIGRALKLKQRATPLVVIGFKLSVENALNFAEIAHHYRGYGAGRTIWDVIKKFKVKFNEITWEMLDEVDHFPIVIIRR